MRRLMLVVVTAAGLAGCAVMGNENEGGDPLDARPKYAQTEPSTLSKVGNAALSVPATVVWWPYKIVTSAGRGGYDGVVGGVGRAPMPVVGVLASPLTAAAGIVNGTFSGVTRGPAYVGDTDAMGRAFGSTLSEPIPLWKDRPRR